MDRNKFHLEYILKMKQPDEMYPIIDNFRRLHKHDLILHIVTNSYIELNYYYCLFESIEFDHLSAVSKYKRDNRICMYLSFSSNQ